MIAKIDHKTYKLVTFLLMLWVSLACNFVTNHLPIPKINPSTTPIQAVGETVKKAPTSRPTKTPTVTATLMPNFRATAAVVTQTAAVTQTQQARPMSEQVNWLKENGQLSTGKGTWYRIDDFDESWDEPDRAGIWNIGYQPVDFIIRANLEWWSANDEAVWFNSGCGFVFRAADLNSRLAAIFTLDGRARFDSLDNGKWLTPKFSDAASINPMHDRIQIMLIVEGNRLIFFREGKAILEAIDGILIDPKFQGGEMAFFIMSGTDVGFGTRCKLSDVELWILR